MEGRGNHLCSGSGAGDGWQGFGGTTGAVDAGDVGVYAVR